MAFLGGDIKEITWNHPTLGTGRWEPKSAEDFTFDLGGYRSSDDANGITGSGTAIRQMNNVRWSAEGTLAWDMNVTNELEQAKLLAADPVDAEYTITSVNGSVWRGTGFVVGDVQGNANQATFSIKLSGGGALKKII